MQHESKVFNGNFEIIGKFRRGKKYGARGVKGPLYINRKASISSLSSFPRELLKRPFFPMDTNKKNETGVTYLQVY